MPTIFAKLGLIALAALAASGCTSANLTVSETSPLTQLASIGPVTLPVRDPSGANVMPGSRQEVSPPPGFMSFCLRFPDQCTNSANQPAVVSMTPAVWAQMVRADATVNDNIWPEDDQKHYGREDFWTIPTDGYGDCEDYALTKRKLLITAGISEAALRIAVVVTPREVRHAVLTVTTDKGDFVLDNLRDEILPWDKTEYRWIERQDPAKPYGWVSLQEPYRLASAEIPLTTSGTQ